MTRSSTVRLLLVAATSIAPLAVDIASVHARPPSPKPAPTVAIATRPAAAIASVEAAKASCRQGIARLIAEQKLGFTFDHTICQLAEHDGVAWKVAADANDPGGLCLWGLANRYGIGVKQDAPAGRKMIARAAELGNAEAMAVYSRLLRLGNLDEEPDSDAANEWLSKALEAKSALAADSLPVEGARDLVSDGDVPAALKAFEEYAAKGNLNAKVELAFTLRLGWLVNPDTARSVKLLTEAAEAGHIVAMMELADIYSQGRYVRPDIALARKWYKAASDTGDGRAIFSAIRAHSGQTLGPPEPQIAGLMIGRLQHMPGPTPAFALFLIQQTMGVQLESPESLIRERLIPAGLAGEPGSYMWLSKLYRDGGSGRPVDPARSRRLLERGLSTNSAAAINELACAYRFGWYGPPDEEKAVPLYFRAARLGNVPAMASVALRLGTGRGVKRDIEASQEAYLAAALAGDAESMMEMARWTLHGFRKGKPDPEGAKVWARLAIDSGKVDGAIILFDIERDGLDPATPLTALQLKLLETAARYGGYACESRLGRHYLSGTGVTQDKARGLALLREAADRDPRGDALVLLGNEYMSGAFVPLDPAKGLDCFKQAAARGNGSGWSQLGHAYLDGLGVTRNVDEAVRCFEKGIALGNAEAITALARMRLIGTSIKKDVPQALAMFADAADRGSGSAAQILAELSFFGFEGVEKDANQGSQWAAKAVDMGQPRAAFSAAVYYRDAGDYAAERHWLQIGEQYGIADCINGIGVQYRFGHGVPQDFHAAFNAYQHAADRGCRIALCNLAWCYETGNGVEKDLGEAFRLQLRAAIAGEPEAMFQAGRMYLDGVGIRRDQAAGLDLLVKAANAGHEKAKAIVAAAKAQGLIP